VLYMGQFNVIGSVPTVTINIPPGVYNMTLYNVNTASSVYLAVGTSPTTAPPNFTAANGPNIGLQCHSIPTSWNGYQGSRGGVLWAMSTVSTSVTVPVNYILSTQE
jgi:hypothetical protein